MKKTTAKGCLHVAKPIISWNHPKNQRLDAPMEGWKNLFFAGVFLGSSKKIDATFDKSGFFFGTTKCSGNQLRAQPFPDMRTMALKMRARSQLRR